MASPSALPAVTQAHGAPLSTFEYSHTIICRSFEVYFRLLALSALTFELYLRRQLFRDGGFRDLLRLPRLTVAIFHDLLWLLYLERYYHQSQQSRLTCELLQLLSTTYYGYFTSKPKTTTYNTRAYD